METATADGLLRTGEIPKPAAPQRPRAAPRPPARRPRGAARRQPLVPGDVVGQPNRRVAPATEMKSNTGNGPVDPQEPLDRFDRAEQPIRRHVVADGDADGRGRCLRRRLDRHGVRRGGRLLERLGRTDRRSDRLGLDDRNRGRRRRGDGDRLAREPPPPFQTPCSGGRSQRRPLPRAASRRSRSAPKPPGPCARRRPTGARPRTGSAARRRGGRCGRSPAPRCHRPRRWRSARRPSGRRRPRPIPGGPRASPRAWSSPRGSPPGATRSGSRRA